MRAAPLLALLTASACVVGEPIGGDSQLGDDGTESGEAESGGDEPVMVRVEIENVGPAYLHPASGSFTGDEGAIGPGESLSFSFPSRPGDALSFASMLVESNDLFVAPRVPEGIALFDGQLPVSAELQSQIELWDAGTEADQPLASGSEQPTTAPGVSTPDTNAVVHTASDDQDSLPFVVDFLRFEVNTQLLPDRTYETTVTLTNTADPGSLAGGADLHLSPGVWVLHQEPAPLFTEGEALPDGGLELLAEEGDATSIVETMAPLCGITQMLSPGAWAITREGETLFELGMPASLPGLESLAEDGDFSTLGNHLVGAADVIDTGLTEQNVVDYANGALTPGAIYRFEFEARPGDALHALHMFAPSNDWVVSLLPEGLSLFDDEGQLREGEHGGSLLLVDAGTEVNQLLGYGLDQIHMQPEANWGANDADDKVRVIEGAPDAGALFELRVSRAPADGS